MLENRAQTTGKTQKMNSNKSSKSEQSYTIQSRPGGLREALTIKTQRQVKSQHCTFSPKSPKFQEYQNDYPKLPNHNKIIENL